MAEQSQNDTEHRLAKWDSEEAALLLQGYLIVKAGWASRTDVIAAISRLLRQRAFDRNGSVSEKFRNVNGIEMQMGSMAVATGDRNYGKWTCSELFRQTASMYQKNYPQYAALISKLRREGYDIEKELGIVQ